MRKKTPATMLFFATLLVAHLTACGSSEKISKEFAGYIKKISVIEKTFIDSIPIYSDYITPSKEKKLRKYLLPFHLRAAKKYGIPPLHKKEEIAKAAKDGRLTKVKATKDTNFFFYNVPFEYRYLTPAAAEGLTELTKRFQMNLQKKQNFPPVKIAVSSMFRTVSYNTKLMKRNSNASIKSTHSAGVSFDIFIDDYYVKLPDPEFTVKNSEKTFGEIKVKLGFLMGDALRRQFKTILHETLTELQDEGFLYAIIEKRQRCYHVTILK